MKREIGIQNAVRGREEDFPYLARAVENVQPADRLTIEWEVDGEKRKNSCQIVRSPSLDEHLEMIERVVRYGVHYEDSCSSGAPRRFCGGAHHFLHRDLEAGDRIVFRPLMGRDTLVRDVDYGPEYLTEFTLEVG